MLYQHRCDVCGLWLPSWWGRTCRRCENEVAAASLAAPRDDSRDTGRRLITTSPYDSTTPPVYPPQAA